MRAEGETAALAAEVAWREKAMWLLVRCAGGEFTVSDELWQAIPERRELIIDHVDGAMVWTAKERGDEKPGPA